MTERVISKNKNGMAMLLVCILQYAVGIMLLVIGVILLSGGEEPDLPINKLHTVPGGILLAIGIIWMLAGWIPFLGLKVLRPQEALVLTLFGKYTGTIKEPGFYFVHPFSVAVNPAADTKLRQSGDVDDGDKKSGPSILLAGTGANLAAAKSASSFSKKISLKVMTLNNARQKINDVLGTPVEIKNYGTVAVVGGGVGIAEVYPIARALKEAGNKVIAVLGARTKDLLILEPQMRELCDKTVSTTDDGSYGQKGMVTDAIQALYDSGEKINAGFIIGPIPMMKFTSRLMDKLGMEPHASLNPIMLDGTGMCGCCRVTVEGKVRFACVDGPMFPSKTIDFDELLS